MTNEELTNWHNTIWWPAYNKFLATPYPNNWKAGGKGESLKKVLQMKPSEATREEMTAGLRIQTEHRSFLFDRLKTREAYDNYTAKKAKGGESVYKNRQSRTYLHNMGWIDDIPRLPSTEPEFHGDRCRCGNPALPGLTLCNECNAERAYERRMTELKVVK